MNDPGIIYFMMSRFPSRPLHDYYMNALRNYLFVPLAHHAIYVGYHDWRAWTAREGINDAHISRNNPNQGPFMNRIEYNYTRGYVGHPVNRYPRHIPKGPQWVYGDAYNKYFSWFDALFMSRLVNPLNPSLRIFNWARYNPGNHIPGERVNRNQSTNCIVCVYFRLLWNVNCTRPEDRLGPKRCRVEDEHGNIREQSTSLNSRQKPMHHCQQCRFPLCSLHFHQFHDVTNPAMNLPGPKRNYDDEEDPERIE